MLKDLLKLDDFMAKRLEGRLFCGANKRIRQEIPEVHLERQDTCMSVQLPTFWTVVCFLGL